MMAGELRAAVETREAVPALPSAMLAAANINPATLLATDYLNHFNEIVMLLEILPSVPELADDVLAWQPRGYRAYFEGSSFKEKALAILAYEQADRSLRRRLEAVVEEMNRRILAAQDAVREAVASQSLFLLDPLASLATTELRPLIDQASGLINGRVVRATEEPLGHPSAQDAIDALFE